MRNYSIIFILIFFVLVSCSTTVKLATEPEPGYDVYYNNLYIGKTPCEFKASNLAWKDHNIRFERHGRTINTTRLKEEYKCFNWLFFWLYGVGIIWGHGPVPDQKFYIDPNSRLVYFIEPGSKTKSSSKKESAGPSYISSDMRIAIMDFEAKGISRTVARNVAELIRAELINSRSCIVIERSQMGAILREQGLQQTGCTEVSCAVKVGRLLSAKKILIGSVMKMGSKIIISGRVVDVEKGIGETAANQSATSIDELDEAVKQFSIKLLQ